MCEKCSIQVFYDLNNGTKFYQLVALPIASRSKTPRYPLPHVKKLRQKGECFFLNLMFKIFKKNLAFFHFFFQNKGGWWVGRELKWLQNISKS